MPDKTVQFPPHGMIFLTPDFFLLEDSLAAGVQGTGLPSLLVIVVTPFFVFAGQGGVVESLLGVAVLPAPPVLGDDAVPTGTGAPLDVAGCAAGVPEVLDESPVVPAVGGTITVLPSRDVICLVADPLESCAAAFAAADASPAVPVIFMPGPLVFKISPAFSSGGLILGSPNRAAAERSGPECTIPVTFDNTPGRSRGV